MNHLVASERSEFKSVDQNNSEHIRAKIELSLLVNGAQKSSATIALSPDGVVKISTKSVYGSAEGKSYDVRDAAIDYQEIMMKLLERLYPPKKS